MSPIVYISRCKYKELLSKEEKMTIEKKGW